MSNEEKKAAAARAALDCVEPGMVLGIGTGSTVNHFIDVLPGIKHRIEATVSSSEASTKRLQDHRIPVLDLNAVDAVDLYVDGADEATRHRHLIKGGGGALTREKIIAAVAARFVCIVDDSKLVERLGAFPLPVEVLPMARSYAARSIQALGGNPFWRDGFVTDNGNVILDVHNFDIIDPIALESALNQIVGVVSNGLFAARPADRLLVARDDAVETIE